MNPTSRVSARGTLARVPPKKRSRKSLTTRVVEAVDEVVNQEHNERTAAWRSFAQDRGGTFYEEELGVLGGRHAFIDVPHGDALVRADVIEQTERVGKMRRTVRYTRFRAAFLLHRGPEFHVYPATFFSSIGAALGFQDLALGVDPEFDDKFIVKTPHENGTRIAFNARAQELVRKHVVTGAITSNGSVVTFVTDALLSKQKELAVGTEIVGELARFGERFMAPLRALDGARYVPPEGPFEARTLPFVALTRGRTEIVLAPSRRSKRLEVSATATLDRAMEPFELSIARDGVSPEPPAGLFGADALDLLSNVAPATLRSDGTTVHLDFHESADTPRLATGVRFLASVASGSTRAGAFR